MTSDFRLLIFTLLLCLGCSKNEPEEDFTLRLTVNERTRIDTLYANQVPALRDSLDSLCTARFESLVQHVQDSIIKERLAEEARLRARLPVPVEPE